ncbi:MAG TPA: hypothetical protein VMH31_13645, partial [Methylomirabilota bacterium]|nr:hypothetical protein [Methylomirabilota bacterium]
IFHDGSHLFGEVSNLVPHADGNLLHKPIHPAGLVQAACEDDEPAWCWVEWACFSCTAQTESTVM